MVKQHTVTYPGTSGELTLDYGGSYYFERSGDLLTLGNNSSVRWILDRETDPSGGHCY
jgi:hypothetical protein